MTCIAWDGKTLAADKRILFGAQIHIITKIHKINGCLVGSSGSADSGAEMVDWFANGADPEKFKDRGEDWGGLLVILPNGEIHKYQRTPIPIKMPQQNFAIGSGCEYAIAAMHLGCSAKEAVEVACALDPSCGNGIDTLTLGFAENIIKTFRTKTIDVEAWQFTRSNFQSKQGTPKNFRIKDKLSLFIDNDKDIIYGTVETTEGRRAVLENDWIIKGLNGEFYPPCNQDIFNEKYEAS